MKKLLIITIIAFNAITIFAQTQKYDIMTFTPPKGWSLENGDNAKVYTKIDKAKNTLGIIMLYPSIDSSGDANEDFKYVWKSIVQDSFGASAKPETETSEDNGFKIVNGGEMIKYEGIQALAMLTVLSGKRKVVSILTITNDQSYVQSTQAMIESMTIDAKGTNQPSKRTNNSDENTDSNFSGDTGGYKFTTPPGWSVQRSSDEITLKNGNNIISMLPFVKSSGNLEADANRIMFEVFKGWVPWTENGFKPDHADLEKGKTIQGFNYFLLNKTINKSGDTNFRWDAIILLVEVGGNVAVIAGNEPFQSLNSGETTKALDLMLFDLSFSAGKTQAVNLKSELVGEWSMFGGSVGSSTTYNPDGTFLWAGAIRTTTSISATTDRVTTSTYANNGSYTLNGNILTTTFKSTGKVNKDRIRFYQTRNIGSSEMFGPRDSDWQSKMGKLSLDGSGSGTVVYSKD